MQHYLFMCRSLTYAQRASRLLERAGITASGSRTPHSISGSGCGYCVSVQLRRGFEAASLLREAGLLQGSIYIAGEDGSLKETSL